jgi:1,4-alpha-glucan branching enzyme
VKNFFYLLLIFFVACSGRDSNPVDVPDVKFPYSDGITRISDDSLAFVLLAPNKEEVYLVGDFNGWEKLEAYKMEKSGERFHLKIGNLSPAKEYVCQYLIDNEILVADPYSHKVSDSWNDKDISPSIYPNLIPYPSGRGNGIATTVSTAPETYDWKVEHFTVANPERLVIYEILIRDFTEKRSIKGVQEKLPYLKSLGVTAVELMPFSEFEGNDSWGYNPSFYFAPDKAYGTSADYKAFIDECHANGMAVIMDMVLNHSYGQSPMVKMYQSNGTVAANNPWYNVSSPNTSYSWGYDFDHESKYTQEFVDNVCAYWIKEYKVDGYRFDFTKGFTNKPGDGYAYDQSRIDILTRMANAIWKHKQDAIVIFEHLTDNREEKALAEHGILLWGNLNYSMNEATMGWGAELDNGAPKGDISSASYRHRGWTAPNLVAYMESHDEERIMFKNTAYGNAAGEYNVKDLATALKRTEAAAVMLMSIPGPKMIWQFGELGYDFPLEGNGADRLTKKPIRWDYLDDPNRKALRDVYAEMIALRTADPVFSTPDYTTDLTGNFKYVALTSAEKAAVAIANFDVVPATKPVSFGQTGTWREHFSKTEITVTSPTENIQLTPGEYRLYFFVH